MIIVRSLLVLLVVAAAYSEEPPRQQRILRRPPPPQLQEEASNPSRGIIAPSRGAVDPIPQRGTSNRPTPNAARQKKPVHRPKPSASIKQPQVEYGFTPINVPSDYVLQQTSTHDKASVGSAPIVVAPSKPKDPSPIVVANPQPLPPQGYSKTHEVVQHSHQATSYQSVSVRPPQPATQEFAPSNKKSEVQHRIPLLSVHQQSGVNKGKQTPESTAPKPHFVHYESSGNKKPSYDAYPLGVKQPPPPQIYQPQLGVHQQRGQHFQMPLQVPHIPQEITLPLVPQHQFQQQILAHNNKYAGPIPAAAGSIPHFVPPHQQLHQQPHQQPHQQRLPQPLGPVVIRGAQPGVHPGFPQVPIHNRNPQGILQGLPQGVPQHLAYPQRGPNIRVPVYASQNKPIPQNNFQQVQVPEVSALPSYPIAQPSNPGVYGTKLTGAPQEHISIPVGATFPLNTNPFLSAVPLQSAVVPQFTPLPQSLQFPEVGEPVAQSLHGETEQDTASSQTLRKVVAPPPGLPAISPAKPKKTTLKDILAEDCTGAEEFGYCASPPRYPTQQVSSILKQCSGVIEQLFVDSADPSSAHHSLEVGTSDDWSLSGVPQDDDQEDEGSHTCESTAATVEPGYARDASGRWLVVLQHHSTSVHQRVAVDVCAHEGGSCKCKQQYETRNLIAWDPDQPSQCPTLKAFKFPTKCNCPGEKTSISA